MTLLTHRPSASLSDLIDWIDTRVPIAARPDSFIPVEEFVDEGTYVVRADLPGIDPEKDVSVTIADDILTIEGERHEEKHDKHRSEVHYGSFTRRLRLPAGCSADEVAAAYADGVLKVTVPLTEPSAEPTRIPIARAAD